MANPAQPRGATDSAGLAELAQSIRQQGILQPLLVRTIDDASGRFQIVAGERRWRAAREAGLSSVPCVVQQIDDRAAALAALVENLQREDLNALDEALGFRNVIDAFELNQEELALAVGKSRSHVTNTLRLLNLPANAREALRGGRISAGHARAILSHADPEAALRIVLGEGLNVREDRGACVGSNRGGAFNESRGPALPASCGGTSAGPRHSGAGAAGVRAAWPQSAHYGAGAGVAVCRSRFTTTNNSKACCSCSLQPDPECCWGLGTLMSRTRNPDAW